MTQCGIQGLRGREAGHARNPGGLGLPTGVGAAVACPGALAEEPMGTPSGWHWMGGPSGCIVAPQMVNI